MSSSNRSAALQDPFPEIERLIRGCGVYIGRARSEHGKYLRSEEVGGRLAPEVSHHGQEMAHFREDIESAIAVTWAEEFAWLDFSIAYLRTVTLFIADEGADAAPGSVRRAFVSVCDRGAGVGHEVLALLRAGFPRGAHARWRTLYELGVIARVLGVGNKHTASRFLAHAAVMGQRDGELLIGDQEAANRARRAAEKRFSVPFQGPYGWASELTGRKLGVTRPNLGHLESLAELSEFDPYNRLANHHVHAGSMGMLLGGSPESPPHFGCDPRQLGPTLVVTMASLAAIGVTALRVLGQYTHSRPVEHEGLAALGEEIHSVAPRYLTPSAGFDKLDQLG